MKGRLGIGVVQCPLAFVERQRQHRPTRDQVRTTFHPSEEMRLLNNPAIIRRGVFPVIPIFFLILIDGRFHYLVSIFLFVTAGNGPFVVFGILLDSTFGDNVSERRPLRMESGGAIGQILLAEALRQ